MLLIERVRVLVFVGLVASVYLAAAVFLGRSALRRLRDGARPVREPWLIKRVVLSLAALGILCFAWGLFVEPYWLDTVRVRLESPKLAGAARPIKLVLFSDMHCDGRLRLEERLIESIAAERPDLIFFAGDAANSPEGVRVFRSFLERVARLAPTFAVRGNWDNSTLHDCYAGMPVSELHGEPLETEVAGARLWIAGLADRDSFRTKKLLARTPADRFTVLILHRPDEIETAARAGIDLYLAGHTHGGQVALPFYGALVTFSEYGKRFESGLHRVERTWLYVTRGIGMTGLGPRIRFCARPELTVIEIRGKA